MMRKRDNMSNDDVAGKMEEMPRRTLMAASGVFRWVRSFIDGTMGELRKCSWPSRDELYQSTLLIVISLAILSIFIAVVDEVSRLIINSLTM